MSTVSPYVSSQYWRILQNSHFPIKRSPKAKHGLQTGPSSSHCGAPRLLPILGPCLPSCEGCCAHFFGSCFTVYWLILSFQWTEALRPFSQDPACPSYTSAVGFSKRRAELSIFFYLIWLISQKPYFYPGFYHQGISCPLLAVSSESSASLQWLNQTGPRIVPHSPWKWHWWKINGFENSVWEQPTWLYCDLIYFLSCLHSYNKRFYQIPFESQLHRTAAGPSPGQ